MSGLEFEMVKVVREVEVLRNRLDKILERIRMLERYRKENYEELR